MTSKNAYRTPVGLRQRVHGCYSCSQRVRFSECSVVLCVAVVRQVKMCSVWLIASIRFLPLEVISGAKKDKKIAKISRQNQ